MLIALGRGVSYWYQYRSNNYDDYFIIMGNAAFPAVADCRGKNSYSSASGGRGRRLRRTARVVESWLERDPWSLEAMGGQRDIDSDTGYSSSDKRQGGPSCVDGRGRPPVIYDDDKMIDELDAYDTVCRHMGPWRSRTGAQKSRIQYR